jgi:hypothetical protein
MPTKLRCVCVCRSMRDRGSITIRTCKLRSSAHRRTHVGLLHFVATIRLRRLRADRSIVWSSTVELLRWRAGRSIIRSSTVELLRWRQRRAGVTLLLCTVRTLIGVRLRWFRHLWLRIGVASYTSGRLARVDWCHRSTALLRRCALILPLAKECGYGTDQCGG